MRSCAQAAHPLGRTGGSVFSVCVVANPACYHFSAPDHLTGCAAIPGVAVTIVNQNTGLKREVRQLAAPAHRRSSGRDRQYSRRRGPGQGPSR